MWNDLPYTVFDTAMLMCSMVQPTVCFFPVLYFLQFSMAHVLVGLQAIYIKLYFSPLGPVLLVLIIIIVIK